MLYFGCRLYLNTTVWNPVLDGEHSLQETQGPSVHMPAGSRKMVVFNGS